MKKVANMTILLMNYCLVFAMNSSNSKACTRVVYKGPNSTILTGRTMDFATEIPANLWIFPRGMERSGQVGRQSFRWRSRFGSLAVSSWDISTTDGMNEKGLVANLLWLVESQYPNFNKSGPKKGMAISLWAQYVLDQFATVEEAVRALKKEPFVIVSDFIPGTDKFTTVHLSISDASGDSAIFEYINGKLMIHHNPSYTVMTNDPTYKDQLAIKKYWEAVPGKTFLPGSVTPADRFVRASFFIQSIPQTEDERISVASVFSVLRNVSVPYGFTIEGFPNLSTTRWRAVADQKNLTYYFETTLTPNIFWVDFKKISFRASESVKKLDLGGFRTLAGESSTAFKDSQPFDFIGLEN